MFCREDGAPHKRVSVVKARAGRLQTLLDTDPNVDPICYPLLLPRGTKGFKLDTPHVSEHATSTRNRVTMQEYYNYK